ncbi:putative xanthine dehydrogenase subunit A [Lederbergia ruris]|uniref:Xanthine dehydrogenase subunit A n=1 Tax=Lederbergia ruris TaxID=217495 RepID=A0ABQ4KPC9_9BACI|nr:XdhC/CoxI family protein [Lederbergia ruris]GIN59336.1 putative xanthine dehydrogenase subunit A [Lederbergia ruris]
MEFIHDIIEKIVTNEQPATLAIIIEVEGSSYRKKGAWMLSMPDQPPIGLLSGGCLEQDIQAQSKSLYATQTMKKLVYDLSSEDDLGWGKGAGCNGEITVLLRDIDSSFRQAFTKMSSFLKIRKPVLYVQALLDYNDFQLYTADQPSIFHELFNRPFSYANGIKMVKGQPYYYQMIWPKPHLYILGAGPDARPLTKLAALAGFSVHVFDWRKAYGQKHYFPDADSLTIGNLANLTNYTTFGELDFIILMTHDFQQDAQLLEQLQHTKLRYLGILGSKKRTKRLLKNNPLPNHLYTPVGLAIGAEGPTEIAISIVAELIAIQRGKII